MKTQCLLEYYYGERLSNRRRVRRDLMQKTENNERNDQSNDKQLQAIRALGANLRTTADSMQIRPSKHHSAVGEAILPEEGLNDEEKQVIRRIYTEKTPATISKIARHLQMCLTSRTFHVALGFLCSNTSSVTEELAAICELVRLIYPSVQEVVQAGPIYDELQKAIEDKLDEVLH